MDEQTRLKSGKQAVTIALVVNACLAVVKGVLGYMSGSTVVMADAFNDASDLLVSGAIWGGLVFAYKPPDDEHHYGYGKAEPLVAMLVASVLAATAVGIGFSAYRAIGRPESEAPGWLAVVASLISVAGKESLFRYTLGVGRRIGSSAVVADAWHVRSDVIASLGALVGSIGARIGPAVLDPVSAIFVGILILKAAGEILKDALAQLLDKSPDKEIVDTIEAATRKTDGVQNVHAVRARVSGPHVFVDLIICVDKKSTVEEGHRTSERAKREIMNECRKVKDVSVQVNPCYRSDHDPSLCASCPHAARIAKEAPKRV